jgi:acetyl esterase/lipase
VRFDPTETTVPDEKNLPGVDVRVVADQVCAAPGGHPLLADLYLPESKSSLVPAVLWLHGGGWKFGDRKQAPDLSRHFASRGIAMASIDYRLTGEAIFPAQIHDVKTAIRWLKAVAPTYGIDPDRVALWGSSAGGHLAALAALCGDGVLEPDAPEHADQSTRVAAVVDGYGPIEFLKMDRMRPGPADVELDPLADRPPKLRSIDAESFESLLLGAPLLTRLDLARVASPLTYVKPGAPPFLILHGRSDLAIGAGQSELLFEALAAAGNEVDLLLIEKLGHAFFGRPEGWGDGLPTVLRRASVGRREPDRPGPTANYALVEAFFRRHLGG